MMKEELIHYAAAIILSRAAHWKNAAKESFAKGEIEIANKHVARAAAYQSAYDILWYAIHDNGESLKEFDYYT